MDFEVSCCGVLCSECPVHIATVKDDVNMKRFLAHELSSGEERFSPEDIVCDGCRMASADVNKFGKSCEIRKCCKENKVRLCAECKKFPCEMADELIPEGSPGRLRTEEMHEACKGLL